MYQRTLRSVLQRFAQLYPVVGIMGPRQSGKSTLAKLEFSHLPYVSLENLDIRVQAQNDPGSFLRHYHNGAIFDEIQHVPQLLSYLQEIVDTNNERGRYIITGSQNFALNEQITQSLAGRIGMTTLLPLSLAELSFPESVSATIFQGGYPRLHDTGMTSLEFYPSYIQTYVERDVRQLKNVENLITFQTFLKLCAGRVGQVINFSSLAQDCGISHSTAREWLSILEASFLVFFIAPFYQNYRKRVIKMPKLYFYDTGLACSLLGLEQQQQLETHYLKGALYENLVILELLKGRLNKTLPAHLYFWRDQTGHEIDVIAEWGGTIHACEIKASATFQPDYVSNLSYFMQLSSTAHGYLIYNGTQEGTYDQIRLLPLRSLSTLIGT